MFTCEDCHLSFPLGFDVSFSKRKQCIFCYNKEEENVIKLSILASYEHAINLLDAENCTKIIEHHIPSSMRYSFSISRTGQHYLTFYDIGDSEEKQGQVVYYRDLLERYGLHCSEIIRNNSFKVTSLEKSQT